MRRIKILYYWLFNSRHNVSFLDLLHFLFKPVVKSIAQPFIKEVSIEGDVYKVSFSDLKYPLFWPKQFPIEGVYQVTAETFDTMDWHYYRKAHTEIAVDEVLLDIGTAEGLFVLAVIDKCKKVILVEPNDYFVNALNKSLSSNKQKVVIHNVAVGSHSGEVYFNSDSLASAVGTDESGVKKRLETIDALVLDEPSITYLKADLEGFELEMLKGAKRTIQKHKPKIAITTYHPQNDWKEIVNLVKTYVPEYNFYVTGVFHEQGKPVMIHMWTS